MFAEETSNASAMWNAISVMVTALVAAIPGILGVYFAYKAKVLSQSTLTIAQENLNVSQDTKTVADVTKVLVVDNTLKTVETQKAVNGKMDVLLDTATKSARAEGVLEGIKQAQGT